MPSRFIAIGVGQGDAFFFQRENFAALNDGGRSINGFFGQFERVVKRKSVDVLVCTHNDSDHANGVLGFLEGGLECDEVWLPASWTDRLEDLLLRPEDFMGELLRDIDVLDEPPSPEDLSGVSLLQRLGDQYANQYAGFEQYLGRDREELVREQENIDSQIAGALEAVSEPEADFRKQFSSYRFLWYPPPEPWFELWYRIWREWPLDSRRAQLLVEAIAAGERIRQIALAAFHRGSRIRWFEYTAQGHCGGSPEGLMPLNAHEVLEIPIRRRTALEYLALTTSNKQSLVLYSPPSNSEPGILFTADSDLSFSQRIPWHPGMIITAPHHGSESNARAYQRFKTEAEQEVAAIWVRSDGRFKTRPGPSYLEVSEKRFCTLCRGFQNPKQNLRFTSYGGKWKPVVTRKCQCE